MASAIIKKRFTVDEYYRMAKAGILCEDDRVELIDGEVLVMSPLGARHAACVTCTTHTFFQALGSEALVRSQNPVRLDPYHEPEPDVVILRGQADFYASQHPGPDDFLLLIEVADSSLEYDRDVKAPIYAAARILEYWLTDLNTNVVWRFVAPERGRYQSVEAYRRGQSITPLLLPYCTIAVDTLLIE